jgi:flagella synthesis protein FlgN
MAHPFSTVDNERTLMSTLVDLMNQEQQCLVEADTDGLNALTPRKSQLIAELAQLAKQRHASLEAAGFAADDTGMAPWLAAHGDPAAQAGWTALLDATRAAKELNRVNGLLISKHLTHTQHLIAAMRTPTGAAETGMYGPSGQPLSASQPRRAIIG